MKHPDVTKGSPVIHDLLAAHDPRPSSIDQRVEQRLTVLRKWLVEGLPFEAELPKSLTAARLWEDASLPVEKISSPNEFTKTHLLVGSRVCEIAALLTKLREKYGNRAPRKRTKTSTTTTVFDQTASERQLRSAVSQWHMEREKKNTAVKRAEAAEARSILLCDELSGRDKLIADLRRQLMVSGSLRPVK